jgi:hypothetical protein
VVERDKVCRFTMASVHSARGSNHPFLVVGLLQQCRGGVAPMTEPVMPNGAEIYCNRFDECGGDVHANGESGGRSGGGTPVVEEKGSSSSRGGRGEGAGIAPSMLAGATSTDAERLES